MKEFRDKLQECLFQHDSSIRVRNMHTIIRGGRKVRVTDSDVENIRHETIFVCKLMKGKRILGKATATDPDEYVEDHEFGDSTESCSFNLAFFMDEDIHGPGGCPNNLDDKDVKDGKDLCLEGLSFFKDPFSALCSMCQKRYWQGLALGNPLSGFTFQGHSYLLLFLTLSFLSFIQSTTTNTMYNYLKWRALA